MRKLKYENGKYIPIELVVIATVAGILGIIEALIIVWQLILYITK